MSQEEETPARPSSTTPEDRMAADLLAELRQLLTDNNAPEDVMRLVNGPGRPDEIMQQLVEAGVLPEPEESIAALLEELEPLLTPEAGPLDAELAGADLLATAGQGVPAEEAAEVLTAMVNQAEQHGGPVAVAMLRALAATAPQEPVRTAAGAAADRLVAGGVGEPHWAGQVGAPTVGDCFGYSDDTGEHSIVVEFRYGGETHAFVVLIDETLGGGVRDVWVTDTPAELRADYRADPEEYGEETAHSPAEAHVILTRALDREPCPVEPDEVDDVDSHLDLLRQRVALLARAGA